MHTFKLYLGIKAAIKAAIKAIKTTKIMAKRDYDKL